MRDVHDALERARHLLEVKKQPGLALDSAQIARQRAMEHGVTGAAGDADELIARAHADKQARDLLTDIEFDGRRRDIEG